MRRLASLSYSTDPESALGSIEVDRPGFCLLAAYPPSQTPLFDHDPASRPLVIRRAAYSQAKAHHPMTSTTTTQTQARPTDQARPVPPSAVEPLLSLEDPTRVLSCSRRLVERLKAAGELPRPDLRIGRMPRWRPETIRRWIGEGGRP